MERWRVLYVATNGLGGKARKAILALRAWSTCACLIFGRRVDLVHVHTASFSSFWRKSPVFAMAIAAGRPLVVSLHGGAFRDFYAARGAIGKAWIRLVLRRAARFVVLTNTWKRWAEATEGRTRVVVIPNPVPEMPNLETQEPATSQAARDSPDDVPLLLYLGRIEHEKGIFVLLEALAEARHCGANWRLICGGSGDIEIAQQHALKLGLAADSVRFLGWIDGDAKRNWLRRCDMLVLPSFAENMPVVLLEAFAYGKPVAASSVGGVPDMVLDGQDGFLFPPGDSHSLAGILLAALKPNIDLERMGASAREKAAALYAPRDVIRQVEAMYAQLLKVG